MKIFIFLLTCLIASIGVYSQSTLPLRADTILLEKTGGNTNLKLKDSSRNTAGGILTNIGGGVYTGRKPRKVGDTLFIGSDTISVGGTSNILKVNDSVFVNSYLSGNYRFRDSVRWGIAGHTIREASLPNIRNDASSVIRLTNGTLIVAYTAFAASSADADEAVIMTKMSYDNGRNWVNLDTAVQMAAFGNYIPSLYFNPTGDTLRMLYLRANSLTTNQIYSTYSVDFTSSNPTWSSPVVAFGSGSQYYSPASDRVLRSKSGIYYYPLPINVGGDLTASTGRYDGYLIKSLNGITWDTVPGIRLISPDLLFVEGGLVQTDDAFNTIIYYARTRASQVYFSFSQDDCATFSSNVLPWGLYCSESMTTVKYIESLRLLVAGHNRYTANRAIMDLSVRKIPWHNQQNNTIPNDGRAGQWQFLMRIDSMTTRQYIEPTLTTSDNEFLVTYSDGDLATGDTFSLKTKIIPYPFLTTVSSGYNQQLILNKTFNIDDPNWIEMYSVGIPATTGYVKLKNLTAGHTSIGAWLDIKTVGQENALFITPHCPSGEGAVWINADNGSGADVSAGNQLFRISNNGVTTAKQRFGVFGDGSVRFNNSSGEMMRLTATGRLGIGTDVPNYTLDVNGKVAIRTADSTESPVNMLWQDPVDGQIKKSSVPIGAYYPSYIIKYYIDTATEDQSNVGGSSTIELSNGNHLTAYTGFGTNPEDGGSSTLYAINSFGNLRSFYNKRQIVALDTLDAHFGPSLYRSGTNVTTGDTIILIWGTQINGSSFNYVGDIRTRTSTDGGATWGAISILRAAAGEYYNNFPNRIFRTNTGKLLYPFEKLRPGAMAPDVAYGFDPRMLVSTNNGATWSYSTAIPNAPDSGCVETGFYQRPGETRLFWYGRSFRKSMVYTAYSDDDGVTWTTPAYMNFMAGNAATTIKYLKGLDFFIGFTNRINGATQFDKRKYLNAFASLDGQNWRQIFCLDTALENSAGVIGLTDIISFGDTSLAVIYSYFHPTTNYGDMKAARIPKIHLNTAFENIGAGLEVPSGGDADRPSFEKPLFRWNTTGFYEGNFGSVPGYGAFHATGHTLDPVYPFKTMRLQSVGQIGRLTLYNMDAHPSYYGDIQFEKSFNNSYNLGGGQVVGQAGGNTMTYYKFISNEQNVGGFSNIDHVWQAVKKSTESNAELMRLTSEGTLKINTDANGANFDGRRLYVNGSIGANKDSITIVGSLASKTVMLMDTLTGRFERVSVSGIGGYTFTNGLTNTSGTVTPGGTVTSPFTWTLATSSDRINITGTSSSAFGNVNITDNGSGVGLLSVQNSASGEALYGYNTAAGGIGVYGHGTGGVGVTGHDAGTNGIGVGADANGSGGIPFVGNAIHNGNSEQTILKLMRINGNATGGAGLDGNIIFQSENDGGTMFNTAKILAVSTDATGSSENSELQFFTMLNGTFARRFTIKDNGQFNLANYTSTTHSTTNNSYQAVVVDTATGDVYHRASALVLRGATSWQPGVVAAGSSATTTISVTGAALGDPVTISKASGAYSNGEVYDAFVSGANTVTIRVHNVSTGSANYNTTETYQIILLKY